jgi:hypothetical protein
LILDLLARAHGRHCSPVSFTLGATLMVISYFPAISMGLVNLGK